MAKIMDKDDISIKTTLLGSVGVGKTCIIHRYTDNKFNPLTQTTDVASYNQKVLTVDNKSINIDLWDTAGQEKYRSLGRNFYKDSYIVCLVYDITNRTSFEDIENIWYEDLKRYGEKCTITAIVANKSDLYESEEVKEEEGRKFAESINCPFFLVSAKEGSNIDSLFNTLVGLYLGPEFSQKLKEIKMEKGETTKIVNTKENVKTKKNKCC